VIAGIVIGLLTLKQLTKKPATHPNLLSAMILGLMILIIITSIPGIGWALKLLVMLWALGAGLTIKKKEITKWR
jgi:hypothetical protein